MTGFFVDTSGWAAFLIRTEPFHRDAVRLLDEARKYRWPVVTTNYVMTELIALLTRPMRVPRRDSLRIVGTLRSAEWIRIVHIDELQDNAGWAMLETHRDKTWSLVDAAGFVVMRHCLLTHALTTDHHFEQAGFLRLLKTA